MSKDTKSYSTKKVSKYAFLFILFVLLPSINCNFISIKFKGTGETQFFINPIKERDCPDKVYVDKGLIPHKSCKYYFPNKIVIIKLKWDKDVTNFYRLFSDISNIIEVDLSEYNTSLVTNMAYMLENCKDLIFTNLSNIDISSLLNIDNMLSNCFNLQSIDLTNVEIEKIPSKENIFKNCVNLRKKNNNINKRFLQGGNDCNKYTIFNDSENCVINTEAANQEIVEGLDTSEYREFLIKLVDEKNTTSVSKDDETFTITITSYDENIKLGVCEEVIKEKYGINSNQYIYMYKHVVKKANYYIPIINYELFINITHLGLSQCENKNVIINYVFPVEIKEDELYKHDPNDEYYSDNCSIINELSIYDRKKEYNDKNLSLCQTNCNYTSYNSSTKKVTCDCTPTNSYNQNEELINKLELKEEDRDKCMIGTTTDMIYTFCTIYEIFEENRDCKINIATANKEIVEGLNDGEYRDYLINQVLTNKNEYSTIEDNEKFTILKIIHQEQVIDLGQCETELRRMKGINMVQDMYMYRHEINKTNYKIPIIGVELFVNTTYLDINDCQNNIIIYNIPVSINIDELYKHDPNDEYYSDNCYIINELSIYDRKKEYNDKNLSLCQTNCNYTSYNSSTKKVTCDCPGGNMNNNGEVSTNKFELKYEDKLKCSNKTNGNKTIEQQYFEDMVTVLASNKTGKDKENIFDNMLQEIMNGSLNNIVEELVNNGQDFVASVDGDTYHLTSLKQQFYTEHLTAVDLGDCEEKLRVAHGLGDQELLIFKIEHSVPSFKIPIIEYVILTENGRVNIDLDACAGTPVNYLIPVDITEDKLYLYDPKNEFYTDLCHPHTSDDGTDMTLYDRKNEYNTQNMSLCEEGCDYEGYNETTKKTKCVCPIKTKRNFFEIDQDKLLNKFKNYKDIINIMIVKCYNLVFSGEGLKKNIGSYILISIAAINGCLIAFFYLKGFANLKNTMKDIFNKSFQEKPENKKKNKDENTNNFPPKKEKHQKHHKNSKNKNKKNRKSIVNNIDSVNNLNDENNNNNKDVKHLERKNTKKRSSIKRISSIKKSEKVIKVDEKGKNKEIKGDDEIIYLNDYELNSLSYDDALKYEKRTYWQYYISLIKTKELVVFTFYTNTDYNSRQLKIILFLLSFALFYTVNALFFNDSTMHQIYEDEGDFNFVYQIPQILYSTIISTVIKMIISFLSLTEKNFIQLKNKKSKKLALKELDNILKCIAKKCIAFFILCYFFNLIFWYYLSCFCAVYKNTQTYLIKDTVISFCTSLLYPFAINLLPGLLRMPALKSKKKWLYIISTFVALI